MPSKKHGQAWARRRADGYRERRKQQRFGSMQQGWLEEGKRALEDREQHEGDVAGDGDTR